MHADPGKAAQLGSRGGRRRTVYNPGDLKEFAAPKNAADLLALLAESIVETRTGKLDPKLANSIAYLGTSFLRAIEVSDLEARLRSLEEREQKVAPLKDRVERLEQQARFRDWLRFHRYLDGMSVEQLELFAVFGHLPDPPLPEPPKGTSRLDTMSQKELLKLFEADQRELARFASLNEADKWFFIFHGHWPEAACEESSCRKSFSDELHRKYGSRRSEVEGVNLK